VPKGTARRLPRICPFCFIKMAVMNWIGLYLHPPGPLSDGVAKNQIEQHRLWSLFPGDTVKLRFSQGQWKCQFIALPDRKAAFMAFFRTFRFIGLPGAEVVRYRPVCGDGGIDRGRGFLEGGGRPWSWASGEKRNSEPVSGRLSRNGYLGGGPERCQTLPIAKVPVG